MPPLNEGCFWQLVLSWLIKGTGVGATNFKSKSALGKPKKLGGFLAGFRRVVGKKPFNTAGPLDKKSPHGAAHPFHVRAFQFKHWFGGQDMFQVYGKLP